MTDTESKYKILIDRLRDTKPVTGNPDLLTDEIMQAIRLQHKKAKQGLIVWIRPLMAAASLFLFGLFLYQQLETTDAVQDITRVQFVQPSFQDKKDCSSASTINLSQNRKLLNQYMCYMKSNMAENESSKQFYQKYLAKHSSMITQ